MTMMGADDLRILRQHFPEAISQRLQIGAHDLHGAQDQYPNEPDTRQRLQDLVRKWNGEVQERQNREAKGAQ